MSIFVFLVSLGVALRLTRLAIQDTITQPIRDAFARLESRESSLRHTGHFFRQLLDCPWCFGFWASAATTWLALRFAPGHHHFSIWTFAALTFAMSWLVGFIYTIAYTVEIYEPNAH